MTATAAASWWASTRARRHDVIRRLLWSESLTAPWIDLDAGMIYRRGREEKEQRTKRRPVVKIPKRLLAHMRRWARKDEAARRRDKDPLTTNAVLHHGGQALAGPIRTGFEGCVRHAGIRPEITPHWMRHTAATWLMETNADPWEAAGYLGMTMATLEKHYGHLRPRFQSAIAAALTAKG